ncbi:FCD domain-containing protein [Agrobacterium sp. DKPNP3]|uniref:FCD domain-containing protein n=1 Tax=Agrobacterium sp. DKPNP3 TaxID=3457323 RepID=UPI004044D675
MSLLPASTYALPDRIKSAQQEHEEIVAAIAHGDGDAAEAAARRHVANGYRIRLEMTRV